MLRRLSARFSFATVVAASFLLISGNGQVWAIDWGACQQPEVSELQPHVVIPACSQIIESGIASHEDLAIAHYRRGRGHVKDGNLDRAIADWNEAIQIKPDYANAYYSRGVAYGYKGDLNRAIADLDKAVEIDPNYANAYFSRGASYHDGGDLDRAIADYDKAIQLNPDFAVAYFNRGIAYGATDQLDRAIADYDKAIEFKPDFAAAYRYRGEAKHEDGQFAGAFADLTRAAELGDAVARTNLGLAYYLGQGTPKDLNEAVKWYRLAAEQGQADAQRNLGLMYAEGEGVPQDEAEAVRWFRLAADQNHARAQFNLGLAYANGRGVEKNESEAVKWFKLSAEQGHDYAQFNLGIMYENGQGVRQDHAEALKWYRLAADQGLAAAQAKIDTSDQDLPVVPTLEYALGVPAQSLAGGYLAIDATLTMVEYALSAGIDAVDLTLDGQKASLTQANAEPYLKALGERLETYRKAIDRRGFGNIAGQYALDIDESCLDTGQMFAVDTRNSEPVIADELGLRQAGFEVELVLQASADGQSEETVFPGVTIEDAVVFSMPTDLGFNFWGVVDGGTLTLRFDVEEVKNALGGGESGWQTLEKCVFTLTRQ